MVSQDFTNTTFCGIFCFMSNYTPENPFGIPEERSEAEQLRGHITTTIFSGGAAVLSAYFGAKTGTEIAAYTLTAASDIAQRLGFSAVIDALNVREQS